MKSEARMKTMAISASALSLSSGHRPERVVPASAVSSSAKNLTKRNSCSIMFLVFPKQETTNMNTFKKSSNAPLRTHVQAIFGCGASSATLNYSGQQFVDRIGLSQGFRFVLRSATNGTTRLITERLARCSDEATNQFRL